MFSGIEDSFFVTSQPNFAVEILYPVQKSFRVLRFRLLVPGKRRATRHFAALRISCLSQANASS